MPNTKERDIERLMAFPLHLSREQAERHVRDDDLWLVDAELRSGLDGEAAVKDWREALNLALAFAEGFSMSAAGGPATMQMLWDLRFRAEEALRRAEERAAEASTRAH